MVTIQHSQATDQRNALMDGTTVKSVQLPNGVNLPYVEQGGPAGVPVVFLHGVTDSWRSWEPVLPYLPGSIHAFTLSQRGHGDADRPASGYRFADFSADLAAFMDAHGIGPAIVVGHSMGSYVAQRFTMDHPERVRGLVLVGSVTTWRGNPVVTDIWESVVSTLTDPVDPAFVREFQEGTGLPQELLDMVVQESLKVPAHVWRGAWHAIANTDYSAELRKIQAPTLIIWGDQDPLCPRDEQEALVAGIASARLVVYPDRGHNPHWEAPERFAADLVDFIDRLTG
ncbi:MAG: alpha/beta fold hydrolase [Thermomicrobiales bacterium]